MITVLNRPQGHVLKPTSQTASVTDSSGDALFTLVAHGMVDGDYIYVLSNVEDYNGFWYVNEISGSTFKIQRSADDDPVLYSQDEDVTFYKSILTHGFSCVHLPIVYRLRSDLNPTNESDTPRDISTVTSEYGYTRLTLSGSLGTFEDLSFIKITGTESLDGVYQIIDKISTSDVMINLAYDSSNDFTGALVILYYQSYHVVVRVYAGVDLAATLRLIPNTDNEIILSVADILKGFIKTRNNLLLGSLPRNSDFTKAFYISYAESYDTSDGYTVTTYESAFTVDAFGGVAVNALLPFKNRQSGYLSDYLFAENDMYEDDVLGRFLTLFTTPKTWTGFFFDLSFLKNVAGSIITVIDSVETEYPSQGDGLYRFPITPGDVCVQIKSGATSSAGSLGALSTWVNYLTGEDWITGAAPEVTLELPSPPSSKYLRATGTGLEAGVPYTFTLNNTLTKTGGGGGFNFRITAYLLDSLFNIIATDSVLLTAEATVDSVFSLQSVAVAPAYLAVQAEHVAGLATPVQVVLNSFTLESPTNPERQTIEEICLELSDECYEDSIYITWLNYLGGFEYWLFTAEKEYITDITAAEQQKKNIFPEWPKSYGETADTIRRDSFRESRQQIIIRSQYVTLEQLNVLKTIKESILVQELVTRQDRRTLLVDTDSFTVYTDDDQLYQIQFTASYTNDNPVQTL